MTDERTSRPAKAGLSRYARPALAAAVAVAAIAAVSLATTVWFARAGLDAAANSLVRGEGHALIATILDDTRATERPVTMTPLDREITRRYSAGLRYVAVVIRGHVIGAAGTPLLETPGSLQRLELGQMVMRGQRVRLVGALPPVLPRAPGDGEIGDPHRPPEQRGAFRGFLVIEFETSIVAGLQATMLRTQIMAGVAAAVLLLIAAALYLAFLKLARAEDAAERARRLAALGQMSAIIAHELRNPIAALKGHCQLLAEDLPLGTPEANKARRIEDEAQRLERLTATLLDYVREGPLDLRDIAPAEWIATVLQSLPGIRVSADLSEAPATLRIDAARLGLALSNLLRNAAQAAPDEAVALYVVAREVPRSVVIEVRDRGAGIPSGEEERIFEPFVTTRVSGTGLGLAAARRAVEQHGGKLDGASHPDGGAVFRITLPRN
ncbi:HAMP domain-containing histidine kinase [Niveibacterium sp. 24ML]|uniref:sensor histidine kinase n=1 Tax=Niveibacterium sp. 24ML TaxID=2985512 RepID=UPI00226F7CF5|nr:HAMP domain-containing sensor histidine kinase [Niveibacterium sp. 24ML]MCX9157873.1 HAMP domain-containing histidine kinase [Niveibacterium sp. 24ML]